MDGFALPFITPCASLKTRGPIFLRTGNSSTVKRNFQGKFAAREMRKKQNIFLQNHVLCRRFA